MGREQDRASLRAQIVENFEKLVARHGVETACRLIENQKLRAVGECERKIELHLHPLGKLIGRLVLIK